jgi:ADP-ribosyl-[dinitrogen reductase] hydrolase
MTLSIAYDTYNPDEVKKAKEVYETFLYRALKANNKSEVFIKQTLNSGQRFVAYGDEITINGKEPSKFSYRKVYENVIRATDFNKNQLNNSGYIIHSLQVSVWAFHNYDNFKDGLQAVIELGGDVDTNAAIYKQLASAYYCKKNISPKSNR